MTSYSKSFIISLLLHVGVLLFLSVSIQPDPQVIPKDEPPLQVEVIEKPKELKKLSKYNNQEDKDATILSEQNNKGSAKNGKIDISGGKKSQFDRAKELGDLEKDSKFNSLTSGDNGDDGEEADLSSKQIQFFSFFKRLREQLKQEWIPMVRAYIVEERELLERKRREDRTIPPLEKRKAIKVISKVFVSITPSGQIKTLFLITNSENKELDRIAIEAWKKAAPFVNVPKEMLEDGVVQLEWRFIVLIRI